MSGRGKGGIEIGKKGVKRLKTMPNPIKRKEKGGIGDEDI